MLSASFVASSDGRAVSYDVVDADGMRYSAFIDSTTGEVAAVAGNEVIQNTLSANQQALIAARVDESGTQLAPLIAIPIAIGAASAMCYLNDQVTKNQMRRHCEARGGTVRIENSGMCGFGASYRCENLPPSTPRPGQPGSPLPTPGTPQLYGPGWGSGSFQLIVRTNANGRNTFDSDWFGY